MAPFSQDTALGLIDEFTESGLIDGFRGNCHGIVRSWRIFSPPLASLRLPGETGLTRLISTQCSGPPKAIVRLTAFAL